VSIICLARLLPPLFFIFVCRSRRPGPVTRPCAEALHSSIHKSGRSHARAPTIGIMLLSRLLALVAAASAACARPGAPAHAQSLRLARASDGLQTNVRPLLPRSSRGAGTKVCLTRVAG
jgi:hypothetical protein